MKTRRKGAKEGRLTEPSSDVLFPLGPDDFPFEPHSLICRLVDFEAQNAFAERDDVVRARATFGQHEDVSVFDI